VKVAIIGTGRMGRGFATALAPKHQVTVGSRDPDRARKVAAATGAARGATYAEAAADAEVVILTVPWPAIDDTLGQLGELHQAVVIDVSWPARKQERDALKGSSTGDTSFVRVNVWRGQAEHLADSLAKGDRVMVTGRLRQRSWETPDGDKGSVTEIEADEVGASLKEATAKVERVQQRGNGDRAQGRERQTERGGDFSDPAPF
jgi:single stranded DNA-binding protein